MTPADLASLVRKRTKTDTTTFPDADLLEYANTWLYEMSKAIREISEDYFGVISTTDLVTDQRQYTLPVDILTSIKKVEVKFSSSGEWISLYEFDIASYPEPTDETTILQNFSNEQGKAAYDIYADSLFIYSGEIIDVTDGLKLYSFQVPDEITDLSESSVDMSINTGTIGVGFPKEFHELLARRVVIEYKENAQQPIPLNNLEQKFDIDFKLELDKIESRNQGRSSIPRVPLVHGAAKGQSLPHALQSSNLDDNMDGFNY